MNVGGLIDKIMIGILAVGLMISTGILPLAETTVKVANETYSVSEYKEKPYLNSQLVTTGILSQDEADNAINTMIEKQGLNKRSY